MNDNPTPMTELSPDIAFGCGYLLGHFLLRQGIEAVPVIVEDNYTDQIQIRVPHPDHHYRSIYAVVRVEGWREDW